MAWTKKRKILQYRSLPICWLPEGVSHFRNYYCCCSITQLCVILCYSMDCIMPGFPVPHHLLECPSSCPSNWWFRPTISSSIAPLSFCPQSFPAAGSFPTSCPFASGGQSTEASGSASVLAKSIQDWCPLRLIGWSPCLPGDSQESSPVPQFKSINSLTLHLCCLALKAGQ